MKRNIRVICAILIFLNIIFLLVNVSLAATISSVDSLLGEVKVGNTTWNDADTTKGVTNTTQKVISTGINVIRVVGTGIAIIMLTYVAIKYMSAAPSEKAEFKKSATAMIVGAIVLFAATNILKIIANFATANIGS